MGFNILLKIPRNGPKKPDFLGFLQRFFDHAFPLPMGDAQIFYQIKGLTKIHNLANFHLYSICGSQVIDFQKFLWRWSIHEWAILGVF